MKTVSLVVEHYAMGLVERLRSQAFKALDAILTARLRSDGTVGFHLRRLLTRCSNFDKVASFITALESLIPRLAGRLCDRICSTEGLPFRVESFRLINYGTGATVFLLKTKDDELVLKVYRRSLGKRAESLLVVAREFARKYAQVTSWYGSSGLVPRGQFVVLHGPILGHPALALLQPYIRGQMTDLLRGFSDDELVDLVSGDESLRRQVMFFLKTTLDAFRHQGVCIDFLGWNNVAVVNDGQAQSLIVLDNGSFVIAEVRERFPAVFAQIEYHIHRMEALLEKIHRGGHGFRSGASRGEGRGTDDRRVEMHVACAE